MMCHVRSFVYGYLVCRKRRLRFRFSTKFDCLARSRLSSSKRDILPPYKSLDRSPGLDNVLSVLVSPLATTAIGFARRWRTPPHE